MNIMLPEWPNPTAFCEGTDSMYEESQQCLRYERARAEAAMARLKVAVKALRELNHPDSVCKFIAGKALAQIGLPEKG